MFPLFADYDRKHSLTISDAMTTFLESAPLLHRLFHINIFIYARTCKHFHLFSFFLCLYHSRLASGSFYASTTLNWPRALSMPLPLYTGLEHNVFYLSVCPSVHPLPNCEQDNLKKNEQILLQIGTSGLQGKDMKRSILGSRGQRSRSHDTKIRFGGLAEMSFSTPLVEQVV